MKLLFVVLLSLATFSLTFSQKHLNREVKQSIDTVFVKFENSKISALQADVDYYFKVLTLFADTLLNVIPNNTRQLVSVVPFRSSNLENSEGRVLAEGVIFYCKEQDNIDVVDYKDFKLSVKEVSLRNSKLANIPIKIARNLESDYSVSGNIVDIFGERIITGILKETSTGKVVNVVRVVVSKAELDDVTSFVLKERGSVVPYALRSVLLPGWGQVYGNRKKRGVFFMATSVASYSFTAYSWFEVSRANSETKDDKLKIAETASYVSLGIWGLSIIDASIIGYKNIKKYDLYFVGTQENPGIEFAYRW